MTTIEIAGEELELLPERAIHWPARRTLFVADTHWGKAATLRAYSIPVPMGGTDDDLERLSRALEKTDARRLIVLGDALHAREGRSPADVPNACRMARPPCRSRTRPGARQS